MTSAAPAPRHAARVILLNGRGEVLLLLGHDPSEPAAGNWWFTPGGGLEPGEEPRAGAVRELYEETGLAIQAADLHGPVHDQMIEFSMEGQRYRQIEGFYVARVDEWLVDTSGFTPLEQRVVVAHRWWSIAELRATTDRVYPDELVELLTGILGQPGRKEG